MELEKPEGPSHTSVEGMGCLEDLEPIFASYSGDPSFSEGVSYHGPLTALQQGEKTESHEKVSMKTNLLLF